MNDTYSTYLQSEAWENKRQQRLVLSGRRCEACGSVNTLQIHHLTYERIFQEDMDDLMTLCKVHHEAVEEFCRKGVIEKTGDPRKLRADTLKFIAPRRAIMAQKLKSKSPPLQPISYPVYDRKFPDNEKLAPILRIADRNKFKKELRKMFPKGQTKGAKRNRAAMFNLACKKWDRIWNPECPNATVRSKKRK